MMVLSDSRKRLIESVFSLTVLNALNLLLPLVSIPYLIDTVGAAKYGIYSIVYTIIQYVLLVGRYGFHYTSTKQISQNRESGHYVSKIFYSTIIARLILTGIASIFCYGFILLFSPSYVVLFLFGLGIAFGDILNPVWLFQGMERMRYLTIVNSLTKVLFTAFIFIYIKSESDYEYIILLNSVGYIISGVFSYLLAIHIFHIRFQKISVQDVCHQIKEGTAVFFSSAFVNVFNNSYILILSFFLNDSLIGVYSAIDKIIKAAKIVVDPISNALFPHASKYFIEHDPKENVQTVFRYCRAVGPLLAVITLILVVFSPLICDLFLHSVKDESIRLIWMMSPLIVIGGLNYILGIVGLINLGGQKRWLHNLIISSSLGLAVLMLSVNSFGLPAAPLSSLVTEGMLMIITVRSLLKIKKVDVNENIDL